MAIGTGVALEDGFAFAAFGEHRPWLPGPDGLAVVVVGSAVLAFRRIAPLLVFAVAGTSSLAYQAIGYRPEPLPLAMLVALYTVAVLRRPLVTSAAAAAYVFSFTLAAALGWLHVSDDQYYTALVSIVATAMLGYGVALGRARATLAEQRAAAMAKNQDDRMRAAVEQEQSRIAREVHDIVAHDVSVIVAQAAVARRVAGTQPKAAADALASIEAVGRDALDGLRRLFGLLRIEPERPGRKPQPGLNELPWLLDQVRRAGLPVELIVLGEPRPLPAMVELNAHRIIQEALTNSLKHAGPTRATVTLDYRAESLRVEVCDEGGEAQIHRPQETAGGYGLISMQQRATMLGGELHAGPEPERGFRVSVQLPVPEGTG